MPFSTITSAQIAAGEANKQELWQKVKDNEDNHETRILSLEGGITTTFMDWTWDVWGDYSSYGIKSQVMLTRVPLNITVSAARLFIHTAGSAGSTEIDFLFKRGAGAWTSIFTTKPSVAFGVGSNAVSSNSVLNLSNVALQSGDLLRMDITAVQTGGTSLTGLISFSQT